MVSMATLTSSLEVLRSAIALLGSSGIQTLGKWRLRTPIFTLDSSLSASSSNPPPSFFALAIGIDRGREEGRREGGGRKGGREGGKEEVT